MNIDKMLVEATKEKLKEVIAILETSNLSKSHILSVIETASNEVIEDIKNEMWHNTLVESYKDEEYYIKCKICNTNLSSENTSCSSQAEEMCQECHTQQL